MNYTELLEQKVAELKPKVKRLEKTNKFGFSADELLPNHRIAEKCCANCWFYNAGYEGEGNCKILEELGEKFTKSDLWIISLVSDCDLCDFWTEQK